MKAQSYLIVLLYSRCNLTLVSHKPSIPECKITAYAKVTAYSPKTAAAMGDCGAEALTPISALVGRKFLYTQFHVLLESRKSRMSEAQTTRSQLHAGKTHGSAVIFHRHCTCTHLRLSGCFQNYFWSWIFQVSTVKSNSMKAQYYLIVQL